MPNFSFWNKILRFLGALDEIFDFITVLFSGVYDNINASLYLATSLTTITLCCRLPEEERKGEEYLQ